MASDRVPSSNKNRTFEMLALADFCGSGAPENDAPQRIDKSNFEVVLSSFSPRLDLQVADHVGGGKLPLAIELRFAAMADFAPIAILEQTDAFRGYLESCRLLSAVAKGAVGTDAAQQRLAKLEIPDALRDRISGVLSGPAAPPAQEAATSTDQTGDILGDVGMPDEGQPDAQRGVQSLIDQLGIKRVELAAAPARQLAATLLDETCRLVHAQLDEILHHSSFQTLEAAWRGLQLLVTRTDFQQPSVAIHVAHCTRPNLVSALAAQLETLWSIGHVADLVVADFAFDQSPQDVALLKAVADGGLGAYCPVVASASRAILGIDGDTSSLPHSLDERFDAPDLIEWRGVSGA